MVVVIVVLILTITILTTFGNAGNGILSSINMKIILATVIGLESDILARIFILIPGQMYWLYYAMPLEVLQSLWLVAGVITPIKVVLAAIATITIGKSLLEIFPQQTAELDD